MFFSVRYIESVYFSLSTYQFTSEKCVCTVLSCINRAFRSISSAKQVAATHDYSCDYACPSVSKDISVYRLDVSQTARCVNGGAFRNRSRALVWQQPLRTFTHLLPHSRNIRSPNAAEKREGRREQKKKRKCERRN